MNTDSPKGQKLIQNGVAGANTIFSSRKLFSPDWLTNNSVSLADINQRVRDYYSHELDAMKALQIANGGWGGGSTVVGTNHAPLFYDLYLIDPHLSDRIAIQPNLPDSLFLKRVGFERIRIQDLPEYPFLVKLLDSWQKAAPGLIPLLRNSLEEMTISYTDIPLVRIDRVVNLPVLPKGEELAPVIVFNKVLGPRIYRPLWLKLGDKSRLAALIHEGLRLIELKWGYGNSDSEFDNKLQAVTATLILVDPLTLSSPTDFGNFFGGLLGEEIRSQDQFALAPQIAYSAICENMPKTLEPFTIAKTNPKASAEQLKHLNQLVNDIVTFDRTSCKSSDGLYSGALSREKIKIWLDLFQPKNSGHAAEAIPYYPISTETHFLRQRSMGVNLNQLLAGAFRLDSNTISRRWEASQHLVVVNWMRRQEPHIRRYLEIVDRESTWLTKPFSEEDQNFIEAVTDAVAFYNRYLQERWVANKDSLLSLDIETLVNIAAKHPDLKVFEHPEKFSKFLTVDWFPTIRTRPVQHGRVDTETIHSQPRPEWDQLKYFVELFTREI